jgi:competence protein ComGE
MVPFKKAGPCSFRIKITCIRLFFIWGKGGLILRNCKGFSFAETIAAFSIWSIIATILIPQLVLLTQERINTQQSIKAYKILHEKTQQVAYNEKEMEDKEFVIDQVHYSLTWEEDNEYTKACLHWKNTFQHSKSVCFLLPK